MSFVKLSIFGTSFEVRISTPTTAPLSLNFSHSLSPALLRSPLAMSTCSQSGWVRFFAVLPAVYLLTRFPPKRRIRPRLVCGHNSFANDDELTGVTCNSSAKDQLTGSSVAIKKIMKPFSTPVLSKRTYRELKLLKHIQHENVWLSSPA